MPDDDSCARCGRSPRGAADRAQWNGSYANGRLLNTLCPDCQTPEEAEEAVHNLSRDGGRFQVCEAALIPAADIRRLCDVAIEEGALAPTDAYLEEFGAYDHLFFIATSAETDAAGMAFPLVQELDGDEYVTSASGEQTPKHEVDARLLQGPRFTLSLDLHEYVGARKIFIEPAWVQNTIAKAVHAQIQRLAKD